MAAASGTSMTICVAPSIPSVESTDAISTANVTHATSCGTSVVGNHSKADAAGGWVKEDPVPPGEHKHKHKHLQPHGVADDDSKDERSRESAMFAEINKLRHPESAEQELAREHAKYNSGWCGRLVKNDLFERTTIVIIIFNSIAIGWDADHTARFGKADNLYDGPIGFIIVENFFATYFTGEILIRLFAYKHICGWMFDGWFLFDSLLVMFMVTETWVLPAMGGESPLGQFSILRLLRLLRITRVAKLMRMFPELLMIVKGISAASRAVVWTAVLLVMVSFTWAILFTNEYHQGSLPDEAFGEEEVEFLFGSIGKSMRHLLVMGTILDDVTYCTDTIRASGKMMMLFAFIVYILLNSFTLMNMLLGILVEVVGNTAQGETSRAVEETFKEIVLEAFSTLPLEPDESITFNKFLTLRDNEKLMKALEILDVQERHFDSYALQLFRVDNDGVGIQIEMDNLADVMVKMKPGSTIGSLEFRSFGSDLHHAHMALQQQIAHTDYRLKQAQIASSRRKAARTRKCSQARASSQSLTPLPYNAGPPQRCITPEMITRLSQMGSADIVGELYRRLGMESWDKTGVPLSMIDDELREKCLVHIQNGGGGSGMDYSSSATVAADIAVET